MSCVSTEGVTICRKDAVVDNNFTWNSDKMVQLFVNDLQIVCCLWHSQNTKWKLINTTDNHELWDEFVSS